MIFVIGGAGFWRNASNDESRTFRFFHALNDEVFGSLDTYGKPFAESTRYAPNSLYSVSKAASDQFVRACHYTYCLPTLTTKCRNYYGPFQYPEKLIGITEFDGRKNAMIIEKKPNRLKSNYAVTGLHFYESKARFENDTKDSLVQAGQFIAVPEKHQWLKVSCLEEIANRDSYIDRGQLEFLAASLSGSEYGAYLKRLLSEMIYST